MLTMLQRSSLKLRKSVRRYIARPGLQQPFRLLYRLALAGMNYGGAGSMYSAGDELALARLARIRTRNNGPVVVFDVGANIGSYAGQVLRILGDAALVYAFEPSEAAFARLKGSHGDRRNLHLVRSGVGAIDGSATLWSAVPGSVLASTHLNPLEGVLPGESIPLVTLDTFCAREKISHIDLLKLDVEGAELEALKGASGLLNRGAIDIIQFEFGQPSLGARTYFSDLFHALHPRYELYRVLPNGLERLAEYHETLEVFMSTNYLAIACDRVAAFHAAEKR